MIERLGAPWGREDKEVWMMDWDASLFCLKYIIMDITDIQVLVLVVKCKYWWNALVFHSFVTTDTHRLTPKILHLYPVNRVVASLVALMRKNLPAIQKTLPWFNRWIRKFPWRREWLPDSYVLV